MREEVVVPWSKLLQQPTQVVSLLEEAMSVRLARRDAEDLVITKASQIGRGSAGVEGVGRLLTALQRTSEGRTALTEAIPLAYPWARVMPNGAVAEFSRDFVDLFYGCAELGNFAPLAQLVIEWKHTAEVYADPELYVALTRPLTGEDFGPVPHPDDVVGVTTGGPEEG